MVQILRVEESAAARNRVNRKFIERQHEKENRTNLWSGAAKSMDEVAFLKQL